MPDACFVNPLPCNSFSHASRPRHQSTNIRLRNQAQCRPNHTAHNYTYTYRQLRTAQPQAHLDSLGDNGTAHDDITPPGETPPLSLETEEKELLNEQLSAYFESTDTTFQPTLEPFWRMALRNFVVELGELLSSMRRLVNLEAPLRYTPPDVLNLHLSDEAVANIERERDFKDGPIQASFFVRTVYTVTCRFLDLGFEGRPIQRFWLLETIARMPYFAYSSCLHLYATIGWYRSPNLKNLHHAEELNEAYHLAIMESLGGDKSWPDRFLAFHLSIAYYWFLVVLFFVSPAESYRFSQLIEWHAVDTYSQFLEENEEALKQLPAPAVAYEYYHNFMYYFYEFQMTPNENDREALVDRPEIKSLYDVFDNIVRDEVSLNFF